MSKIIFDSTLMKYISFFESLTRSSVKDCINMENMLIFVVQPNQIGKAVGKKGINISRLEKGLKRKIKILEFNSDLLEFVKNMAYPASVKEITEKEGIITVKAQDMRSRSIIIGRNAQNLRNMEKIAKRHFKLEEIKVVI